MFDPTHRDRAGGGGKDCRRKNQYLDGTEVKIEVDWEQLRC